MFLASVNCGNVPRAISHRVAAFAPLGVDSIVWRSIEPARLNSFALVLVYSGQYIMTCRTVCSCHPHAHRGRSIAGTFTEYSQLLSPIISVRSRNSTVASCFRRLSYALVAGGRHGAFHVVACFPPARRRHLCFHFLYRSSLRIVLLLFWF